MNKTWIISIWVVLFVATFGGTADAASKKPKLARDGFVLTGVDGKLIAPDSNTASDKWFFEFDLDVKDDKSIVIKAGTAIELLRSAGLEKMITDANGRSNRTYRIYNGIVTKYKSKNFIFLDHFSPIANAKQTKSPTSQQQPDSLTINEPNDALAMPQQIIEKLTDRPVVQPVRLRKALMLKRNSILTDRTGLIVEQVDGWTVFVFDALGRKVQKNSLRLLPCQILQQAKRTQADELEQLRFKVAGIVTEYKGRTYLLAQRATRVYSHQNFGK